MCYISNTQSTFIVGKIENLTNAAARLRAVRRQMGLDQQQMAKMLSLDRSYLSLLENDRREIQPWVMERLEAIEREHKLGVVTTSQRSVDLSAPYNAPQTSSEIPSEAQLRAYFEELLKRSRGKVDRLGWLLTELKLKIPLNCFDDLE